ncbi:hypothetical protein [Streptosporangium sp. NPDC051022]|uniref:hypothetical protein n=1 Tax=Streptosporangium sp. NPDC051022 TaxID=3155752 RepID=UPI00343C3F65
MTNVPDNPRQPVRHLAARGRQTIACMARTPSGLTPAAIPDDLLLALRPYA